MYSKFVFNIDIDMDINIHDLMFEVNFYDDVQFVS